MRFNSAAAAVIRAHDHRMTAAAAALRVLRVLPSHRVIVLPTTATAATPTTRLTHTSAGPSAAAPPLAFARGRRLSSGPPSRPAKILNADLASTVIRPPRLKEPTTPVGNHLYRAIQATGPLSVGQYMRQALTLPEMGYYMKGDVFGKSGDFVTSPEISQLFGEMIGVWLVSHWSSIGQPSKVRLVELGPGRGTLMLDILSTVQQLPGLRDAVESIHLIDASPFLRRKQAQTFGFDLADDAPPPTRLEGRKAPFVWHDHLDELPEGDSPVFVVCHEFFDALPVFQFERANDGWREILVDIDDSKESEYHFRFVKSTQATTACASMLGGARYEALGVGTRVEVCPEAYSLARAISGRVQRLGGAALFIDYGKNAILGDTFRGIRNHQFTSPLSMPGDSDLTADVDFSYLAQAAKKAEATPHGPITQAAFLEKMGIRPRLRILQRSAEDKAQVTALAQACDRLVSVAGGMGSVYKFLAVTPGGTTAPYPFGEA